MVKHAAESASSLVRALVMKFTMRDKLRVINSEYSIVKYLTVLGHNINEVTLDKYQDRMLAVLALPTGTIVHHAVA